MRGDFLTPETAIALMIGASTVKPSPRPIQLTYLVDDESYDIPEEIEEEIQGLTNITIATVTEEYDELDDIVWGIIIHNIDTDDEEVLYLIYPDGHYIHLVNF